jgi:hypothetical protein
MDERPTTPTGATSTNEVGVATEQRLYQLVRQRDAISEHTFEITFLDREIEAYMFTFG